MPLNRKQLARGENTRKKYSHTRGSNRKMDELDNICEKHKVGVLTFKTCIMSTVDGQVTFVDHQIIKANMRSGIMLIKANALEQSNNIYDIVEIENAKKERDIKKHQDEMDKAKTEIERLKSQKNSVTAEEVSTTNEHHNLLMKLVNESNTTGETTNEPTNEPTTSETVDPIEQIEPVVSVEPVVPIQPVADGTEEPEEDGPNKKENKDKSVNAKRQKAVDQLKEQVNKKMYPNEKRNKYFRNFMKDIRTKFTLEPRTEIKYVEVKAETTAMIIDNAGVYKINLPFKTNDTYFLIIGDLQLKSGLIRQIDPAYKADKVIKEQSEFLERIKAKENAKIKEADENILGEEFDDTDQLGLQNSNELLNNELLNEKVLNDEIKDSEC